MHSVTSELKAKHRAMWASGDYPAMVETFLTPLGPRLVEACAIGHGTRVLDVAAGTGNASIPAAQRGAHVTASDLTPELLEAGRRRTTLDLDWVEADAEALPFADESFEVVMSAIGVMFAPHHADAAGELVRVCEPRRDARPAVLDARRHARRAVSHDGAVRAAAPARRVARPAVGQRGPPARPVRRARRVGLADARRPAPSPPSPARPTTASSSRPATARPSPSAPTPSARAAPPSSTPPSTPSARSGTSAPPTRPCSRWSTCSPSAPAPKRRLKG